MKIVDEDEIKKLSHLVTLYPFPLGLTVVYLKFSGESTVDEDEIEKLSRSTSHWWDLFGEFAPLHAMNKLRVPFIRKSLLCGDDIKKARPLNGFKILDVGCGGGILSEVGNYTHIHLQ